MRIAALVMLTGVSCQGEVWKMNPSRSTFGGEAQPKALSLRIEPHARGEVFTIDRVEADGRFTTSSTILYLDNTARDFEEGWCSGTQSSRRVDARTVEIVRKCASGEWIRILRRTAAKPTELILEITEQYPDGRRFARRLVLERQ